MISCSLDGTVVIDSSLNNFINKLLRSNTGVGGILPMKKMKLKIDSAYDKIMLGIDRGMELSEDDYSIFKQLEDTKKEMDQLYKECQLKKKLNKVINKVKRQRLYKMKDPIGKALIMESAIWREALKNEGKFYDLNDVEKDHLESIKHEYLEDIPFHVSIAMGNISSEARMVGFEPNYKSSNILSILNTLRRYGINPPSSKLSKL